MLQLTSGVVLRLDGVQWTVEAVEAQARGNTTWHQFGAGHLRHYAALGRLLDEYADQLASAIDSAPRRPRTGGTGWNPS